MLIPVILSGGSGSRLWPLSRETAPKQFLPLISNESMLQLTAKRLQSMTTHTPIVICNEQHRFIVAEQLRQVDQTADIILEPIGRNTAPAVALAALYAMSKGDDPILFVLPADHDIGELKEFNNAQLIGQQQAEKGFLVTFGIPPTRPETGYGYIKSGKALDKANKAYQISQFVEKPDQSTAENYVKSGEYYWNSGVFMFKASDYIAELETYAPDILASCQKVIKNTKQDGDFIRLEGNTFSQCRSESIDYAVMEHTQKAAVVALEAGWSDIGSWTSLWEVLPHDPDGNVCRGDVMTKDVKNSYLRSEERLLVGVGLKDCIVVETKDAVLVADKAHSQDVKHICYQLSKAGRIEAKEQRRVYRPWGSYETLDEGERFKVKRIVVKPGASLSLQLHYHRSEHWIVVTGTAEVTCGEEQYNLQENESTYIPLGIKHRIHNPGKIALELIEVQSGAYLGEDDIVRFQDHYGRCS